MILALALILREIHDHARAAAAAGSEETAEEAAAEAATAETAADRWDRPGSGAATGRQRTRFRKRGDGNRGQRGTIDRRADIRALIGRLR